MSHIKRLVFLFIVTIITTPLLASPLSSPGHSHLSRGNTAPTDQISRLSNALQLTGDQEKKMRVFHQENKDFFSQHLRTLMEQNDALNMAIVETPQDKQKIESIKTQILSLYTNELNFRIKDLNRIKTVLNDNQMKTFVSLTTPVPPTSPSRSQNERMQRGRSSSPITPSSRFAPPSRRP
ncbi:MAG: hypothetical protein CL521_04665 [Actinobacteria bacterium]|nr:hypothetical protein [Actinomycetota bacterium]